MRKGSEIVKRKRVFTIVSLAILLFLGGGTAVFLHAQEEYVPPEIPDGVDVERSQVFLSGAGYEIDDNREKTHKKEEKKKEEQKQEQQTEQQNKRTKAAAKSSSAKKVREQRSAKKKSSSGKKKSSEASKPKNKSKRSSEDDPKGDDPTRPTGGGNEETEEERAKKPSISISIANGQRLTGKRVDFTVKVTDYKGRNVPVFSEDDGNFVVDFNGQPLVSSGASGQGTAFRTELVDGNNEIRVSAIDRDGNTSAKNVRFTGDTSAEAEVIGQVYVSIEAPIINLGVIYSTTIDTHPGDTARDVLEKAFSQAGISPTFKDGYLAGIGRTGIAAGAWIDDETREIMIKLRKTEKDPDKQDKNKLKEHDFYDSSGWIYNVNGEFPEMGLGSFKVEDGDEIHLIFQLATDVY